eukprot:ANDGO_04681.mRNA.1 DNA-directed RNA polymerase I subunit rpa1
MTQQPVVPITKVTFSVYDPSTVRSMSVVKITNPTALDRFGQPIQGGLYDAALGPIERRQLCSTCALGIDHCPGHVGHIDLGTPLYNPVFFSQLFRLVRAECLYCQHFRIKEERLYPMIDNAEREGKDVLTTVLRNAGAVRKCENCGMIAPTLRSEKGCKIFRMQGSKAIHAMEQRTGMRIEDVLYKNSSRKTGQLQDNGDETEDDLENSDLESHDEEGEDDDDIDMDAVANKNKAASEAPEQKLLFMTQLEVSKHVQELFKNTANIISKLYGPSASQSMFFVECVLVTASKFRPLMVLGDSKYEHPQNTYLSKLLSGNITLKDLGSKSAPGEERNKEKDMATMLGTILDMQNALNGLMDSDMSSSEVTGIRQLLEKKQGLFRKHMMGKRVNFAARSVISPDVNLSTSEIGIPLYFAKRLSFPTPVTERNLREMQRAVIRGPTEYPGANFVVDSQGRKIDLTSSSREKRIALAKTLLVTAPNGGLNLDQPPVTVGRHVSDGDYLLVNRQPTLHKPSMMCHRARVLFTEHTVIRMHYANCNTYNADFDGDEINLHLAQSQLARAEAAEIAANDHQYTVPTSGRPIRGLIQDHVASGVLLTKRDTFLSREQYTQLVYGALQGVCDHVSKWKYGVAFGTEDVRVRLLPPAIIKPSEFWTGKQVITTVILTMVRSLSRTPLNCEFKPKVGAAEWSTPKVPATEEGMVVFRDGHLCTGVLDKSAMGASEYGIVHACYECYGARFAADLLTAFGKVFSLFLQYHGFTCSMDDLILTPAADIRRREILAEAERACSSTSLKTMKELSQRTPPAGLSATQIATDHRRVLDAAVKKTMSQFTSQLIRESFPAGLVKPFPKNCMSMMTTSGAKGSLVNQTQISALLGQQELEGKRVAPMVSGKTLPSFSINDPAARAGGYIADRFLTGLRPQEYFFHCMAGREGLIDTAVKTARSGYLQRCLIKHLEGLRVHYDGTVRESDGTVVQFRYGDDGLDATRTRYVPRLDFLFANEKAMGEKLRLGGQQMDDLKKLDVLFSKYQSAVRKDGKYAGDVENAKLPPAHLARVHAAIKKLQETADVKSTDKKKKGDKAVDKSSEVRAKHLAALAYVKYMSCVADAGEHVGILAGQSVGEPSTQMTLNTFHFAGVDAAHVTVGIPRLRELLMTASCKTPRIQFKVGQSAGTSAALVREKMDGIVATLSRVTFAEAVEQVHISTSLELANESRMRRVEVRFDFVSSEERERILAVTNEELEDVFRMQVVPRLANLVDRELKLRVAKPEAEDFVVRVKKTLAGGADQDAEEEGVEDAGEETTATKTKQPKEDDGDVDDDEEEEDSDSSSDDSDSDSSGDSDSDSEGADKTAPTKQTDSSAKASRPTSMVDDAEESHKEKAASVLLRKYACLADFSFSKESCVVVMRVQASHRKILMQGLVEKVLLASFIRQTRGISRVTSSTEEIGCDGDAISAVWEAICPALEGEADGAGIKVDLEKLYCNDVGTVLKVYGVEAARRLLQKELGLVFDAYGIPVDQRHLAIIADYMTLYGNYRPMNRIGMVSNPSLFTRASFETTIKFITDAAIKGGSDSLDGPSARIATGQVIRGGTGCFDLMVPLREYQTA